MAHPIDPVRIQSDELLMARLFARTREETSHFHGFLFYSMRVARGFEEVYTRQLGAPPPGLNPGALQAASQYASARLDYLVGVTLVFLLTAKVFHNNYVAWVLPWLGLWLAHRLVQLRRAAPP